MLPGGLASSTAVTPLSSRSAIKLIERLHASSTTFQEHSVALASGAGWEGRNGRAWKLRKVFSSMSSETLSPYLLYGIPRQLAMRSDLKRLPGRGFPPALRLRNLGPFSVPHFRKHLVPLDMSPNSFRAVTLSAFSAKNHGYFAKRSSHTAGVC